MAQPGVEDAKQSVVDLAAPAGNQSAVKPKQRSRRKHALQEEDDPSKRRCVSTACVACRYVLSSRTATQKLAADRGLNVASVRANVTETSPVAPPALRSTTRSYLPPRIIVLWTSAVVHDHACWYHLAGYSERCTDWLSTARVYIRHGQIKDVRVCTNKMRTG